MSIDILSIVKTMTNGKGARARVSAGEILEGKRMPGNAWHNPVTHVSIPVLRGVT